MLAMASACTTLTIAAEPKPIIEGYADYAALTAQVIELDKSTWVTATSLGQTLGGRDIHLLTLGEGEADQKPAVLIVGGAVPSHLVGSELAMRLARKLAAKADADEAGAALLKRFTFYIIPRVSPDAAEAFFTQPWVQRDANLRDTDDDGDGRLNEDGPDDLNGDGAITMMRISDPSGEWMLHPHDPRVLIRAEADKNEQGAYRLLVEGLDNDKDEQFNEDGPGGTAFNRNFTFQYPYFQSGAGPHQVSEVETRAAADFAFSRRNIAAVLVFTPEDNLMHPWKPGGNSPLHGEDAPLLNFMAEAYREIHGGKDAPPSPDGEGAFSEWAYAHYGRWSLAARGWWVPKVETKKEQSKEQAPAEPQEKPEGEKPAAQPAEEKKKGDEKRGQDEVNVLRWLEQQSIAGFVEWVEVAHPDFPDRKVEVGGFKPFVTTNPPATELDGLADQHVKFIERFAEWMPRVRFENVKTEPLGEGLYRLTVTVINDGFLPTASRSGDVTQRPQRLQVAMDLPKNVTLVTGQKRVGVSTLKGNGGKSEQTWLIRRTGEAAANVTLRLYSPTVGSETITVELK